jgi:hypothetical protein
MKALQDIHALLTENPTGIITLHLENYAPAQRVHQALVETQLTDFLLTSTLPGDKTLTLGTMRQKERLVIFSDYAYERRNHIQSFSEKGIHPTTLYKETYYSLEKDSTCGMRTDFRADPHDKNVELFVLNHFSEASIAKDCTKINAYNAIMKRVALCMQHDLFPTFLAVDYFEISGCSPCIGTKQVVMSLNLMRMSNVVGVGHVEDGREKALPTYSHALDILGYIFTVRAADFATGFLSGVCVTLSGILLTYAFTMRQHRVGQEHLHNE